MLFLNEILCFTSRINIYIIQCILEKKPNKMNKNTFNENLKILKISIFDARLKYW